MSVRQNVFHLSNVSERMSKRDRQIQRKQDQYQEQDKQINECESVERQTNSAYHLVEQRSAYRMLWGHNVCVRVCVVYLFYEYKIWLTSMRERMATTSH